ncbi:DNA mismatch repair endonuclease MutL [Echinimonas agarilytica]|uniref:DNA mismatch repair protein MutL n=1 Tax=Echinimonas agarilytica TaxID=1215918 RepID=A0AA41W4R2_9GAMM|nr:DNA mismatch repair endonuclease MutL [Echinimonas agarilytica]MCM2678463.1 DNA mismatch repair endonuclease MutL [Echinimonas agarilytica]
MTIKILPPRLANQIAAGEVVERPASVIKELIENSLDAGATQLEVRIDQGGHKRILIRDNGSGIAKNELTLALSRHATSKVDHLDDIERIATLGFRGEALASISSVSRLTLTSKPADQTEAWLAYAEGRDMGVQIKPAAHPNGSSVEVADLFFNTPARRKFLRAEKTEFHHIEELIKRLAMARFDVGFTLIHNGKTIRNLPICKTDAQTSRRIGSICGTEFARKALYISGQSGDIQLSGWLLPPSSCAQQSPAQYTFINGRMIRDKVVTHAIRQAYAEFISDTGLSAYALYLTLPFDQVDVNVHPAKHEVRFIQSRLVHDFVVQAVQDALRQQLPLATDDEEVLAERIDYETGEVLDTSPTPEQVHRATTAPVNEPYSAPEPRYPNQTQSAPSYAREKRPTAEHWQGYNALMSPQHGVTSGPSIASSSAADSSYPATPRSTAPDALIAERTLNSTPHQLISPHHGVIFHDDKVWILDIKQAESDLHTDLQPLPWRKQPLLLPLAVAIERSQSEQWQAVSEVSERFGIEIYLQSPKKLIIRSLPALLRHNNLAKQLDALLGALQHDSEACIAQSLLSMAYGHDSWKSRANLIVEGVMQQQEPTQWLRELSAETLISLAQ